MKISLSIRIKPIAVDNMDSDELKMKARQIWDTIVSLETDKYDYEQRHAEQDYEFKELNERQKIQLRNKAIKKGLDPEAFTGKHPPSTPRRRWLASTPPSARRRWLASTLPSCCRWLASTRMDSPRSRFWLAMTHPMPPVAGRAQRPATPHCTHNLGPAQA